MCRCRSASALIAGDGMKKKIILLLSIVLLIVSLCACSKRVENLDEFESLLISASSETQDTEPFASTVYVIIPKDCSAELAVRAEKFVLGIYEKTGIRTYLKYDSESLSSGEDALCILLGNTSNTVSHDALRTRKADDYLCMYDRGSIVIGGKSDDATLAALDRFEEEILSTATSASLMHKAAHFEYFHEYDVDTVSLNGFYLYDYAIKADPDGDQSVLSEVLSKYITQKSGYVLDTKFSTAKTINIILDKDAINGIATIEPEEQNVSIRANSVYGLSAAVAKFAYMLIPENTESEHKLDINDKIFVEYENEDFDLLLGVAEEASQSSFDFHVALGEDIRGINSDIAVFLKISDGLVEYIENDLCENYGIVSIAKGERQDTSVVCARDDVLTDAEFGDDRVYTDFTVNNRASWTLIALDAYDDVTIKAYDRSNAVFLIRETEALPLEYANSSELSFSFSGEKHTYKLVFSENLLDVVLKDGEKESIDGSSKTFWNINVSQKYHADLRKLQYAFN